MNLAILLVTAFLSNGVTCNGGAVANSTATTPRFNVSVCITHDVPLCGITYRLRRLGSGGTLRINTRTDGPHFPEIPQAMVWPRVIAADTTGDWGGGVLGFAPIPPGTRRLVATYNVTVLGSAPGTSYSFGLDPVSQVAIDPNGQCGFVTTKAEPPLIPRAMLPEARFTLKKGIPK